MPTTTMTFMGVPVTDTVRVLEALDEFINYRIGVCEDMEAEFNEVEFYSPDDWDEFPFGESVSWRKHVRFFDQSRHYWREVKRHSSKRKEVK